MKKTLSLILLLALAVVLTACADSTPAEPESVHMNVENQDLTVTFDPGTWSSGKIEAENGTYTFAYTSSGRTVNFELVYPDGYVYSHAYTQDGNFGAYASPPEYDAAALLEKGYLDAVSMDWALDNIVDSKVQQQNRRAPSGSTFLVGLLLIGLGIWNAVSPQTAWYLSHGWKFKDAEPSDMAIGAYRFSGVLAAIAGLICLIASF